jgi:hypothetical protein
LHAIYQKLIYEDNINPIKTFIAVELLAVFQKFAKFQNRDRNEMTFREMGRAENEVFRNRSSRKMTFREMGRAENDISRIFKALVLCPFLSDKAKN